MNHHTSSGFKNPVANFEEHSFWEILKWRWNRDKNTDAAIDPKTHPVTVLQNDGIALAKNNPHLSLTWVGHATVYIQLDGKGILTDPIWSNRASPLSFVGPKRYTAPGITIDKIPYLHYVVISHNHYDHMDLPTLKQLNNRFHPIFLTGLGNAEFLKSNGLDQVHELDWWQEWQGEKINFTFTPTQHFSARSLFDRNKTLWGSFIIQGTKTIYFAGDTGYFDGFRKIAEKYTPIHTAILPIGAYQPRWFMKPVHLDPEESIQAWMDLQAQFMLPIHYHTFVLSDEDLDEPLRDTKKFMQKNNVSLDRLLPLEIGESHFFSEKTIHSKP